MMVPLWDPTDMPHSYDLIWFKIILCMFGKMEVYRSFWLLSLQWSVAGLETFTFSGVLRLGMRTEMDCSFGSFGFFHGESAWSVVGCSFLKHWFWYCTEASHDPKIVCVQIFLAQAVAQQRNVSFETTSRR